jgi:hypothetical protein
MSWQINYAISYLQSGLGVASAQHIGGDAINITFQNKPDVLAVISAAQTITVAMVRQYHQEFPNMDFLCGYRKECVWEGDAIEYAEENGIGWGSAGTLGSAILDGAVNTASHKDYFFSVRLIRQLRYVTINSREYDRVLALTLRSGRTLRVGLIMEYEPTADSIRTFWDRFGPIDVAWNINPSGYPTQNAIDAGQELGCEVVKWEDLKPLLQAR